MRLILCHDHLNTRTPPKFLDGTYFFVSFEDLTVGPVADWNDRSKFDQKRSEYWQKSQRLDLPDGGKLDYFVWLQALPSHNLVELAQSGGSFEDIPKTYEFDELIHEATCIEVWHDLSVCGCVFRWYVVAALHDTGMQPELVSISVLPNLMRERQTAKFWSDMLLDNPGRAIPADPISKSEWSFVLQYWAALTKLPDPVEQPVLKRADTPTRDALAVLSGRYPNPISGLTNLQDRLLRSVSHDWKKMARVIGEAMGAGWDENDPVGDFVLQAELEEMARMSPPLVEIDGKGAMRYCRVRLTPRSAT